MDSLAPPEQDVVRRIGLPLYESRAWLKLLGVLSIISGVASALTLIGIVIAWLPIWMGVLLFQAASLVERSYASSNEGELTASLAKLKTYFVITGVLALIGIGFAFLGLAAAIVVPIMVGSQ